MRERATTLAIAGGRELSFWWDISRGVFARRFRAYFGEVVRQAGILTKGSVLIILGLCFSFGLVLGVQAAYGGRLIGAPSAAGAFTAIGNLREIGPYAFAYMMAAKVSTGYVAEIGTMRITDEIDALDVMGFDSKLYLCSTRLLACWLVIPFLYALALMIAYIGSYIAVVVQIGQVSGGGYLELFWKFQNVGDYFYSVTKAGIMGTFVVLVGCYHGFRVRGGPVEVGRATAQAMVVNLVGIHVIGLITTQLFWGGAPRLPIGG